MYQAISCEKTEQWVKKYKIGSLYAKCLQAMNVTESEMEELMADPVSYMPQCEDLVRLKNRLQTAAQREEKVFVFGDYDTDGICATTMMVKILKEMNISCGFYIPDRFKEGYGANTERVKQASEKGYTLLITVDNGVKAFDALRCAKETGMEVAIIDHHTIEEQPVCDILVHPTVLGEGLEYLCGAGCVLQLAKIMDLNLHTYYPLAMLATIGDLMIMKKENRYIVSQGLKLLQQGAYPQVAALLKDDVRFCTTDDIGYYVIPKLNCVGRLADIANVNNVVRFLLSETETEWKPFVNELEQLNQKRKDMTNEHIARIDTSVLTDRFVIVADASFHPGIVGLVATRLSHELHKPVMAVGKNGDLWVGSIRSVESLDLMKCLEPIQSRFAAYGGHKMAAGISFTEPEFPFIRQYLQAYEFDSANPDTLCVKVESDELTERSIAEVLSHGPYGKGMELPKLLCENHPLQRIGFVKKDTYIKCTFGEVEGIWFNDTHTYEEFIDDIGHLRIVGTMKKQVFRGKLQFSLSIESIEKSNHPQIEKVL
ncbi:MAG: DHH family phosphoesterase [Erysipelotrichaceae bacterium]|nr:DHH family phosphoesterase [Erysipelotrichaceae bacterium]